MTRHELRNNLEEIYPIAWGLRYDRNLLIVKLAPDNRFEDINPGDPYPPELYDYLNSRPTPQSKAGYSVNLIARGSTDVLFLTEEVLQSSYRDLQTILLHELAHCLIDSEEDNLVTLTAEAIALGTEFYGKLNPYDEVWTRHTEYFCQVLALGAINYNEAMSLPGRPLFPSAEDCLRSAMRFEQIWD
jgi:hypothetical protein